MPQALGIIGLVVGAVGAGVQYVGAQNAAKTQETLALMNAQAQTQAVQQQGQVNQMQAAINEQLARKDKQATEENARALAAVAETQSAASREETRRSRAEAAKFAAYQRASLAKGGIADTTGSPLALLADTAEKAQQQADLIRFNDEQNRRQLFREVSITKNQGVLAGLNVQSQRLSGMAARQNVTTGTAQARLNYMSERAAAGAMRTGALGGLLNSAGGLAFQGYNLDQNSPRKKA